MERLFNSTTTLAILDEISRKKNNTLEGLSRSLTPNVIREGYLPWKLNDLVHCGLLKKVGVGFQLTKDGKEIYLDEFYNVIHPILLDFGIVLKESDLID